jgi:hypothetical protein
MASQLRRGLLVSAALVALSAFCGAGEPLSIEISTLVAGDADWDWTQARTASVDADSPFALTTMSQIAPVGAHGYHDVYASLSRDRGRTWSTPQAIPSLRRTKQPDGYDIVPGDLWPGWHEQTGKILITGKTFNFAGGTKENILREQVAYAVYDPQSSKCGPLRTLAMPERDHQGQSIIAPNAGCHQRVDLPDGTILLPVRYQQNKDRRNYTSIIVRCRFDGATLSYLDHGTEHAIPTRRGLYEPSLTQFGERYFLTLRADDGAYVARSDDGIRFDEHRPWTFDDGSLLGSYNTQQHWATIGGNLHLIYTRRGADNDHVFRHRAPLFIAQVDPEALQVLRETEQILVPEDGATLGNSGVCRLSDTESWVTVAEGRVSLGDRQGNANRVFLVKVISLP